MLKAGAGKTDGRDRTPDPRQVARDEPGLAGMNLAMRGLEESAQPQLPNLAGLTKSVDLVRPESRIELSGVNRSFWSGLLVRPLQRTIETNSRMPEVENEIPSATQSRN